MSLSKPSCYFDKPFNINKNLLSCGNADTLRNKPCFYKFKSFIDIDKIVWCRLSKTPAAIHFLEAKLDKIDWKVLSWSHPFVRSQSR